MTISSRGNWSVLYVRMVCATTLPKCLVHIVSSLEEEKVMTRLYFKSKYGKTDRLPEKGKWIHIIGGDSGQTYKKTRQL